jgi:pimeloyl-ACP methyl ester carboxylesterase
VKQGPVYIAGNSLGGYLAVMVASRRPDLVKGLFLMNATYAPRPFHTRVSHALACVPAAHKVWLQSVVCVLCVCVCVCVVERTATRYLCTHQFCFHTDFVTLPMPFPAPLPPSRPNTDRFGALGYSAYFPGPADIRYLCVCVWVGVSTCVYITYLCMYICMYTYVCMYVQVSS